MGDPSSYLARGRAISLCFPQNHVWGDQRPGPRWGRRSTNASPVPLYPEGQGEGQRQADGAGGETASVRFGCFQGGMTAF
ncbi:hypothetical protein CKO38_05185 [Rhodospirillum rubrum]|nr:hypothetical protein [Rhodospirillum rubrum]MBK1676076.1 hypothetical protein [Rhodospirillum rubrum]